MQAITAGPRSDLDNVLEAVRVLLLRKAGELLRLHVRLGRIVVRWVPESAIQERIFIERMTSDRRFQASREGSK